MGRFAIYAGEPALTEMRFNVDRLEAMAKLEIVVMEGNRYPKREIRVCQKAGVTFRQIGKLVAGMKILGSDRRKV